MWCQIKKKHFLQSSGNFKNSDFFKINLVIGDKQNECSGKIFLHIDLLILQGFVFGFQNALQISLRIVYSIYVGKAEVQQLTASISSGILK